MHLVNVRDFSMSDRSTRRTGHDGCLRFSRRCFASLFLLFAFASGVDAGMLVHIERVTPRMGQRGTTVEITIQGMCLKGAREIVFYRPGIKATGIESLPNVTPPIWLAHGARIEEQIRCKFEIDADCPLGEHPFRVRTETEITSLGTFHVTPFVITRENEQGYNTNDTIATALTVPLNTTVVGLMGPSRRGDVDVYRVPVTAGQRLSVEVDSVRIADTHYGGPEYDLAIRILDESGHELASNDDNPLHLQDPLAAVKIARDGAAFVEVKRSIYIPHDTDYCVHIGTYRRPLVAFPPGGQAGVEQEITFLGDPLGEYREPIRIPSAEGTFGYFADAPSAILLRSCLYPNVIEQTGSSETRVNELPAALNGKIAVAGEVDRYRVAVKKGDRLQVRVFASTLGSPIDPILRIRRADESANTRPAELEADDATLPDRNIFGTSFRGGGGLKEILDPSVIWEPQSDGDYFIELSDQSGLGSSLGVYRIEVEPVRNAIYTSLISTAFDWMECVRTSGIAIPQGNRWAVNVLLPQGQGNSFRGELELVASGLPAGVRLVSTIVPAGQSMWPVQFVADSSVVPSTALISLDARPVDRSQKLLSGSQQLIPFVNQSGGDAMRTVRLDRFVLAVTDRAPFSIHVLPPTAALVRGGELSIPVKIVRQPGFTEPIEIQCDWIPPGVGRPPAATIGAGETESSIRISAEAEAPLGKWPFIVSASTMREDIDGYLGTGRIRVSSEIAELTVAEPFVELASQPESVRRGERKKYIWSVNRTNSFDGQAKVKLLGLPKGVSVVEPFPVITKDSKVIEFQIEATGEALLGRVSGLNCEVTLRVGDQEIHQRTGNGTLRIDPSVK